MNKLSKIALCVVGGVTGLAILGAATGSKAAPTASTDTSSSASPEQGHYSGDVPAAQPAVATAAPTAVPTPKPTPAPKQVVVVKALGGGDSDGFALVGGHYLVSATMGGSCFYSFKIQSTDGQLNRTVGSFGDMGPKNVAHYDDMDGLPAGTMTINANTGPTPDCPYSLTFTQK